MDIMKEKKEADKSHQNSHKRKFHKGLSTVS